MNNSQKMKESQHQEKDKGKVQRSKQEAYELLLKDVEIARKAILEGKPGRATEIAHKALMDYKEDLGGENNVLLLPGYFIQAEGYIAEGKLKKAEEYLIAAYWNLVQYNKPKEKGSEDEFKLNNDITDEQNVTFNGQIHKIFSKLYLAQKDYTKALDEVTIGIYTDSSRYGPEHAITSLNYYYMGMIFQQKKMIPEAEQFYGKTSALWFKFLKRYFKNEAQFADSLPDDVTIKEALQILKHIEEYFRRYQEDTNKRMYIIPISHNYQAQALIYKLQRDDEKFRNYMGLAYQDFLTLYGEKDPKTRKVSEFVEMIKQRDQ